MRHSLGTAMVWWIVLCLALGGCRNSIGVFYDNRTSHEVTIYDNPDWKLPFVVPPHSVHGQASLSRGWPTTVIVIDDCGRILFHQEVSLEDLKKWKYRIVIEEPNQAEDEPGCVVPSPGVLQRP